MTVQETHERPIRQRRRARQAPVIEAPVADAGPLSREQWVARIRNTHERSVDAVLQVGRDLIAAQEQLTAAEYSALLDDLSLGVRTAQRYRRIAADRRLADSAHSSRLPSSWGTLYELSKLHDDAFAWGMETGRIHPAMERREARLITLEFGVSDEPIEEPTPESRTINESYEATRSMWRIAMAATSRTEPSEVPEEAPVDREPEEEATHVSPDAPTGQRLLQIDGNAKDAEIRGFAYRARRSFHNIAEANLTPEEMAEHKDLDGRELAKLHEAVAWLTSLAEIVEGRMAVVSQPDGPPDPTDAG